MMNARTISPQSEFPDSRQSALLERAHQALKRLYGRSESAFDDLLVEIHDHLQRAQADRPTELKALDSQRLNTPHWFAKPGRAAYCTYIDRFSGTLSGCAAHLDYLKELGVGLFHPLPLLKPRQGDNDGGFAVEDYGAVDPRLGTFDDLKSLADGLRARDMSLVLDVVCNHTAREHAWARSMLAGDPAYKDFYIVLKTEDEVAEWSPFLSDVFPDTAPGSFSFEKQANGWVWTTFYPFQWDLNYANPRVFLAMLDVLLNLANAGVEGFRLDSAAYLWKIKGTICRNLPQAHDILFAFRCLLSVVAPGVFLLAEAIEGLDEVIGYFGEDYEHSECDLAYNNTVMTALWGSLADGTATTAAEAIRMTQSKPAHGRWLNYVRCHDDIIWQALAPWVSQERLQAWSDHYGGAQGSFADGVAFQAPPGLAASTCGMAASLCGVPMDALGLDRLKLLYSVTCALDGVPMIYMGDELALGNDRDFAKDAEKAAELRWLHRPQMDWKKGALRTDSGTLEQEMFAYVKQLLNVQKTLKGWSQSEQTRPEPTGDKHVLVLHRDLEAGRFTCIANFSAKRRELPRLAAGYDLISNRHVSSLAPYQVMWSLTQ